MIVLTKLLVLPRGKCPTMYSFFFTQAAYLTLGLPGYLSVHNVSPILEPTYLGKHDIPLH